jgi:hypothetical protein
VVVERWADPSSGSLPPGPQIERPVLAILDREDPPDPPPPVNRARPEPRRIGELVACLIPRGATIQWGPGVIGGAVVDAVGAPVQVRSGLVTEELVALARRGLLPGPAEAAYVWGGPRLWQMTGGSTPVLRLAGVDHIHDLSALSAIETWWPSTPRSRWDSTEW